MRNKFQLTTMIFFMILLAELSIISCDTNYSVSPRYLFSLKLGNLPGEFRQWTKTFEVKSENHLVVRNGIFYLANGNRILKISSNGYLLDYITDDAVLNKDSIDKNIVNSITLHDNELPIPLVAYPLDKVNAMTVDSQGRMVIVNTIFDSNRTDVFFSEEIIVDNNHLLIYDKGNVQNTIVQDGEGKISGSVKGLYIVKNDTIVLIAREPKVYVVYIMDREGRLSQKIAVPIYKYPSFVESEEVAGADDEQSIKVNVLGILKNVVPSHQKRYLYVQIDYYKQMQVEDGDPLEINFLSTKIFRIDAERNVYDREISLPPMLAGSHINLLQVNKKEELVLARYFSEISGVETGDLETQKLQPTFFFVNQNGKKAHEMRLDIPDISFYDYMFDVDEQGNIAGYFVLLDRVEFYWWQK